MAANPGSRNRSAKLTEEKVRIIRKLRRVFPNHFIAWMFDVSSACISKIQHNHYWKNVK